MNRADIRSAGIVTAMTVLNIAVGLVVQAFLAAGLGTGPIADTFSAGIALPTVIATAFIGSIPVLLIPAHAHRSAGDAEALTRRALYAIALIAVALSLVQWFGASWLAPALAPGFDAPSQAELASFLAVVAPVPLLAAIAAIGQAFAFATGRFAVAGASGVANGLGLLGAVLLGAHGGLTSHELALAVLIGYCVQVLWILPTLVQGYRPLARGRFGAPSTRTLILTTLFLVVSSIAYKSQPVIERLLGTTVDEGLPAALGYAAKLTQGLAMLASFGLSLVAMPRVARALALGRDDEARAALADSLEATLATSVLVVVTTLACWEVLPAVLLERGAFRDSDVTLTGHLLMASLPGVLAGAVAGPLVNVFYARRRQAYVAVVGISGTLLGGLTSVVLASPAGGVGILLGSSLGFIVTLLWFACSVGRVLPGWQWRPFLDRVGPLIRTALAAGAASIAISAWAPHTSGFLSSVLSLIACSSLAVALVVVLATTFGWLPARRLLTRTLARL